MTQLERLIRPFESPGVVPITPAAFARSGPHDPVVIAIGATGDLTTFSGSFSRTETRYMEANHTEHPRTGASGSSVAAQAGVMPLAEAPIVAPRAGGSSSRVVHKKRITNPDDDSQYVDVEVIDEITFQGPNGQIWNLKLKNDDKK